MITFVLILTIVTHNYSNLAITNVPNFGTYWECMAAGNLYTENKPSELREVTYVCAPQTKNN